MAGNRKKPRKPGKVLDPLAVFQKAQRARIASNRQQNERRDRLANLPLGHPMNVSRIAKAFRPINDMLAEQEKNGSLLFDEEGKAVLFDHIDQTWMPAVSGIMGFCATMTRMSKILVWGDMPLGLDRFALRLSMELSLDQDDIDAARATLDWLRTRVATVTPARWDEVLNLAQQMEEQEERARQASAANITTT